MTEDTAGEFVSESLLLWIFVEGRKPIHGVSQFVENIVFDPGLVSASLGWEWMAAVAVAVEVVAPAPCSRRGGDMWNFWPLQKYL